MPRKFRDGDEVVTVGKRARTFGMSRRAVIVGYDPPKHPDDVRFGDSRRGGYRIRYSNVGPGPVAGMTSGFLWYAEDLEFADEFGSWAKRVRERAANRRSSRK